MFNSDIVKCRCLIMKLLKLFMLKQRYQQYQVSRLHTIVSEQK